jgi:hypothetical protein
MYQAIAPELRGEACMLCVLLKVPGKETCGLTGDLWDRQRVEKFLDAEAKLKTVLVLPFATIIETGNHISQATNQRFELATKLMDIVAKTLVAEEPWAAFNHNQTFWTEDVWKRIIRHWPERAAGRFSLGDEMIKGVADFYAQTGAEVIILTGDQGLKAYEPGAPVLIPRRRQS